MRKVKRLEAVRSLLLILGIGLLGLLLWGRSSPGKGAWVEVYRGDLVVSVEVVGRLEAEQADLIGPPGVGRIWNFEISHMVAEGETVERGGTVLGFDTSKLEETLEEKLSDQQAAGKEMEKLQIDFQIRTRNEELKLAEAEASCRIVGLKLQQPENIVSTKEVALNRFDLELCEQRVSFYRRHLELMDVEEEMTLVALREKQKRAAARVAEIEEQIEKMTVAAPHAGTIIYVAEEGEPKKKVGDSVWRGGKVLEIPDLSRMKGVAEVTEVAAGRVALGQHVRLWLDAYPDYMFLGTVKALQRSVRRRSPSDPTKVLRLEIELDVTDRERMRPGMRFQGEVELERAGSVLLIPAGAVFNTAEGPLVYRSTLTGWQRVFPRLGRRGEYTFEVLEGLESGDRVSLQLLEPRR